MVLVDSNVLLDVLGDDPVWGESSAATLRRIGERELLSINPLVYAEVAARFTSVADLDSAMPGELFVRSPLPYAAGFLAGHAFRAYRRRGGTKTSPSSDFLIGAHAAVNGWRILTRDVRVYRSYFPSVELIVPG